MASCMTDHIIRYFPPVSPRYGPCDGSEPANVASANMAAVAADGCDGTDGGAASHGP
jgi:hypothetical protein